MLHGVWGNREGERRRGVALQREKLLQAGAAAGARAHQGRRRRSGCCLGCTMWMAAGTSQPSGGTGVFRRAASGERRAGPLPSGSPRARASAVPRRALQSPAIRQCCQRERRETQSQRSSRATTPRLNRDVESGDIGSRRARVPLQYAPQVTASVDYRGYLSFLSMLAAVPTSASSRSVSLPCEIDGLLPPMGFRLAMPPFVAPAKTSDALLLTKQIRDTGHARFRQP